MAIFIDRHPDMSIPHAARQQMFEEARRSMIGPYGVRPLGHWLEDDGVYCLIEAPSAEAVVHHHAAYGVSCDDLHEIAGLLGTRPTPAEDDQLVRASIAMFWHPAGA
jgi:hypothetical protein